MKRLASHLRAHPHLLIAAGTGIAAGLASTLLKLGDSPAATASLIGWNVGAWLYLAMSAWTMTHADHGHLIRIAQAQAEGAGAMIGIVALAAIASLGAAIGELSAAKHAAPGEAWSHVLFTLITVAGSWLLIPTIFTLYYASLFHTGGPAGGLDFPDSDATFEPDYSDFLYFSFTIAVASQTADVGISDREMRSAVTKHAVLSFVFNTAILAFTINMAASLL